MKRGRIKNQLIELVKDEENQIFIHETAIISNDVTIEGPAYIGSEVEIPQEHTFVHFSWICHKAVGRALLRDKTFNSFWS